MKGSPPSLHICPSLHVVGCPWSSACAVHWYLGASHFLFFNFNVCSRLALSSAFGTGVIRLLATLPARHCCTPASLQASRASAGQASAANSSCPVFDVGSSGGGSGLPDNVIGFDKARNLAHVPARVPLQNAAQGPPACCLLSSGGSPNGPIAAGG